MGCSPMLEKGDIRAFGVVNQAYGQKATQGGLPIESRPQRRAVGNCQDEKAPEHCTSCYMRPQVGLPLIVLPFSNEKPSKGRLEVSFFVEPLSMPMYAVEILMLKNT
jgi:hypothetical protein